MTRLLAPLLLVVVAAGLPASGCRGGPVGTEPISRCVPEDACTEAMFERGTASEGEPDRGAELYDTHCSRCHGPEGEGTQRSPTVDFTDPVWQERREDEDLARTIRRGEPEDMPATELEPSAMEALIGHLRAFAEPEADAGGEDASGGSGPGGY